MCGYLIITKILVNDYHITPSNLASFICRPVGTTHSKIIPHSSSLLSKCCSIKYLHSQKPFWEFNLGNTWQAGVNAWLEMTDLFIIQRDPFWYGAPLQSFSFTTVLTDIDRSWRTLCSHRTVVFKTYTSSLWKKIKMKWNELVYRWMFRDGLRLGFLKYYLLAKWKIFVLYYNSKLTLREKI